MRGLVIIVEEEGCGQAHGFWKWSLRVWKGGPKGLVYRVSQAGGEGNCHYWNRSFWAGKRVEWELILG